jgi:hypothetical protein
MVNEANPTTTTTTTTVTTTTTTTTVAAAAGTVRQVLQSPLPMDRRLGTTLRVDAKTTQTHAGGAADSPVDAVHVQPCSLATLHWRCALMLKLILIDDLACID